MKRVATYPIILGFLLFFSHIIIAQDLEVAGKAKIGTMDKVNTADNVVVRLSDGTLAIRDADSLTQFQTVDKFSLTGNTLELSLGNDGVADNTVDLSMYKELPASAEPGEMLYWNGTAWVSVAATEQEAATLQMISGIPTWTGGKTQTLIVDVTNTHTGEIWMDRNLGATQVATSSTDAASYGDQYQWGRYSDGHQNRTAPSTSNLSTSDEPPHGNFILAPSSPWDWRSPQNDSLWQGVAGTNNPCPSGYRIPTEAEWEAERASWVESPISSTNNAVGAFDSPLKLPMAGRRNHVSGGFGNLGSRGQYWSGSTSSGSTSSRGLSFNTTASMYTENRANALSVRCIKETP